MTTKTKQMWKDAVWLAVMQYLNWCLSTISWRAVAHSDIGIAVAVDSTLASLQFWVFRKIAQRSDEDCVIPWLGYVFGGVLGTISGMLLAMHVLGI